MPKLSTKRRDGAGAKPGEQPAVFSARASSEGSSKENGLEQLARIFEITGCRNQYALASLLGVSQSSIANAKKRGKVPRRWMVTLFYMGVNPDWIATGAEPQLLPQPKYPESRQEQKISLQESVLKSIVPEEVLQKILQCLPTRYLEEELHKRAGR